MGKTLKYITVSYFPILVGIYTLRRLELLHKHNITKFFKLTNNKTKKNYIKKIMQKLLSNQIFRKKNITVEFEEGKKRLDLLSELKWNKIRINRI